MDCFFPDFCCQIVIHPIIAEWDDFSLFNIVMLAQFAIFQKSSPFCSFFLIVQSVKHFSRILFIGEISSEISASAYDFFQQEATWAISNITAGPKEQIQVQINVQYLLIVTA